MQNLKKELLTVSRENKSGGGQKGVSLYFTVIIMLILLSIVLGLSAILVGQIKIIRGMGDSVIALYAADTGIERELYEKNYGDTEETYPFYDTGSVGDSSYTVKILEGGQEDCPPNMFCIQSIGVFKEAQRALEISIVVCPTCQYWVGGTGCVAATTAWGEGYPYSCGIRDDDNRCYNGSCQDCSDNNGKMAIYTCYPDTPCSTVDAMRRASDDKVCWRGGEINESCEDVCPGSGVSETCITEDWDDRETEKWLMVCIAFHAGSVGGAGGETYYPAQKPYLTQFRCYQRNNLSSPKQVCTAKDLEAKRVCVCQY